MDTLELAKLVANGGAMVLLFVVIIMGFKLIPQLVQAWNGMTAELARLSAKIDDLNRDTGQHSTVTVGDRVSEPGRLPR